MAVIEAIATTYLEADAASVTFSSIPATYEHLQLRLNASTSYNNTSAPSYIRVRFNGDSGANYSFHRMTANNTSIAGAGATGQAQGSVTGPANLSPAANFGGMVYDILDYANTNKNTTMAGVAGSGTSAPVVGFNSVLWDSTAALTTILLTSSSGDWRRGSEFTLYGLNSA